MSHELVVPDDLFDRSESEQQSVFQQFGLPSFELPPFPEACELPPCPEAYELPPCPKACKLPPFPEACDFTETREQELNAIQETDDEKYDSDEERHTPASEAEHVCLPEPMRAVVPEVAHFVIVRVS